MFTKLKNWLAGKTSVIEYHPIHAGRGEADEARLKRMLSSRRPLMKYSVDGKTPIIVRLVTLTPKRVYEIEHDLMQLMFRRSALPVADRIPLADLMQAVHIEHRADLKAVIGIFKTNVAPHFTSILREEQAA